MHINLFHLKMMMMIKMKLYLNRVDHSVRLGLVFRNVLSLTIFCASCIIFYDIYTKRIFRP